MRWTSGATEWITIAGRRLECRSWGRSPAQESAIILLHEGLGSAGLWKGFPEQLARQTGRCVFAYSRAGYGQSSPGPEGAWPLDYMTHEAVEVLPAVLDTIGFKCGI